MVALRGAGPDIARSAMACRSMQVGRQGRLTVVMVVVVIVVLLVPAAWSGGVRRLRGTGVAAAGRSL